eukprot:g12296.t1
MTASRSFSALCSRQQRLFLILAAIRPNSGKMLRQKQSVCKQIAYAPTLAWATPTSTDQAVDQIKADGLDAVQPKPFTPKLCVPAPTTTTPAPPTTTPQPPTTTTPQPPTTTTPAPPTTTPEPPTTTPKPRPVREHKIVKTVVNQIETEEGSGFSCC